MKQNSDLVKITADLTSQKEVPSNNSKGKGKVKIEYSKKTRELTWTIDYEGLTGPVTVAHFHGPAMAGKNADPTFTINGKLSSPITGRTVLSQIQESDFLAGKWYLNLHTSTFPSGELRAQVSDVQ